MPSVDRRFLLTKGPPWGFRLYVDNNGILTISKIRRHSPAETAKLRAGDQIVLLNGRQTAGMSHGEAVNLIDTTIGTLDIVISRFETTSTKVLTFDNVDSKIAEDAKSSINVEQQRIEVKPEPILQGPLVEKVIMPLKPPVIEEQPEKQIKVPVVEEKPDIVIPSSPEVSRVPLNKLIKEYDAVDNIYDHVPKKKHFADSSFYSDPQELYPTMEEKIEIARKVAISLTSPDNKNSKGASIFERQRKRAEKFTLQKEDQSPMNKISPDPQSFDLAHWPQIAEQREKSPSPMYRLGYSTGPPPPPVAPPPPPNSNQAKSIGEFMEKVQKFPKAQHNIVTPDVCFNIAAALHSSNSRGAQIFAKRKNRSKKWEVSSPDPVSAQPTMATSLGPSNDNWLPQKSPNKIVSVARNSPNPGPVGNSTSNNPQSRQSINIIRHNGSQAYAGSNQTLSQNNFTQSGFSNVVQTQGFSEDAPSKWRPVKFNVPQRA